MPLECPRDFLRVKKKLAGLLKNPKVSESVPADRMSPQQGESGPETGGAKVEVIMTSGSNVTEFPDLASQAKDLAQLLSSRCEPNQTGCARVVDLFAYLVGKSYILEITLFDERTYGCGTPCGLDRHLVCPHVSAKEEIQFTPLDSSGGSETRLSAEWYLDVNSRSAFRCDREFTGEQGEDRWNKIRLARVLHDGSRWYDAYRECTAANISQALG